MSTMTDCPDLDWRARQWLRDQQASYEREIAGLQREVRELNQSFKAETRRREYEEERRKSRESFRSGMRVYVFLWAVVIASIVSVSLAAKYGGS